MNRNKLPPVHPGEVLLEEFLRPYGISQYRLAKDLNVHPRRINQIVHDQRAVTANTAPRLARHFGTSDRVWLNLQTGYDLEVEKDRLGDRLDREVRVLAKTTLQADTFTAQCWFKAAAVPDASRPTARRRRQPAAGSVLTDEGR